MDEVDYTLLVPTGANLVVNIVNVGSLSAGSSDFSGKRGYYDKSGSRKHCKKPFLDNLDLTWTVSNKCDWRPLVRNFRLARHVHVFNYSTRIVIPATERYCMVYEGCWINIGKCKNKIVPLVQRLINPQIIYISRWEKKKMPVQACVWKLIRPLRCY